MAPNYHLPESIASPVTGRFLAHNRCNDVKRAFLPALRHRVVLSPHSELEGTRADEVLSMILDSVEVPR